ncbi:MAG TPA: RdgB/HAM1 family non-canonical purine NTP pyrophosphatase [Segetibacter sp.]|jgi:XTP/dITP diphosphohydrolase
MDTIIFASNNQHKVDEIKSVIGDQFNIISLKEAGIIIDIPEPHNTLEANATEKSKVIHKLTGENCFSEDTGLEVDVLNGEPGVLSARYAGDEKDNKANIEKLLFNLKEKTNRSAQFRTVISLIIGDSEHLFEGICKGNITELPVGTLGFGYDSIFIPEGATKTFAEMELSEKNLYSHRQKATAQLLAFLSHVGRKMSS